MSSPTEVRSAEGWQIDASAAASYERYLGAGYFADWADELVAWARVHPGDRVLDLACGTGIVSRAAATRAAPGGAVVGVDVNPHMLDVARTATVDTQVPVEWRLANAADLPFDDACFDVVLCQQGLQFFSARSRSLREIHRVLNDDGRLACAVLPPGDRCPAFAAFGAAVATHLGGDALAPFAEAFALGDPEEVRRELHDAGFRDVHTRLASATVRYPSAREMFRQEMACSPLAPAIAALTAGDREVLEADITTAMIPWTDDDGVAFPFETYIVVAHR